MSLHSSAIATITQLEKEINTNALTYGSIRAWPLCRLKIWTYLMAVGIKKGTRPDARVINNNGPSFEDVGQLNAHAVWDGLPLIHHDPIASQEAMGISTESPDLLFFLRPEEYGETIGGKSYAKILDSLFDRFPQYSRLKIEWAEPKPMGFARKNPSLFLHGELASRVAKTDPPYKLEGFDDLEHALKPLSLGAALTREICEDGMAKILWFSRLFDTILLHLKPKAILLSVYYHPLGMGLVLAARRLGIPTVDVQHGRLGPHHGLYTQLTEAPDNGYNTAPDRIWCWGEQTKRDIDRDLKPTCAKHSGIVGGNPWLDQWRKGTVTVTDTDTDKNRAQNFARRNAGQKNILVSLQPIPQPLPEFVIDAMANAPENWSWRLRVHPLRRHSLEELNSILSQRGIRNFEIEDTTNLPLFFILQHSDHHITLFSSVALEAMAFGVRTTLLSQIGMDIFKDYMKQEHFSFADTSKGVLVAIAEALLRPPPTEVKPFIDNSLDSAELALGDILNHR